MEYISKKYNITLIKKQSKFERDYPLIMKRIEALELDVFKDGIETFDVPTRKEGTDQTMEKFKSFLTEQKGEKYKILVISSKPKESEMFHTAKRFVEEGKLSGHKV